MASHSSEVWKYFMSKSSDLAQCLLCKKDYSRKGRETTSLKNHLKSVHKEQFEELMAKEIKKLEEKINIEKTPLQKAKTDAKQRNVAEYFQSAKLWDASNPKAKKLDKCIAEMLVMDDLPFSHVEDIGFMRLMTEAAPLYSLKQRNFYSSMICSDMYESVFKKIKEIIDEVKQDNKLSFTTDVWSDTSAGVSLLSLTAHTINKEFERTNFVLGAEPLEERHTGEYISKMFDDMLMKWDISRTNVHCVLRDAGANMKKALFLSGVNNLDCTVHKIQLIAKTGLSSHCDIENMIKKTRSIATHFHHSTMAQDELQKIQDRLQVPKLSVIHDTPTRWNSTLHMLRRTLEIKESVCVYAATNSKIKQLSNTEWLIMHKCVQALQPYEDITKKLSDSTSTAAEVIPLVKSLKHTLQHTTSVVSNPVEETHTSDTSSEDEPGSGSVIELNEDRQATQAVNFMKEAMQADVEKRFSWIENEDLYRIATYIDPRYKSKFFSSSHVTDQVKSSLARVCEELRQTTILEEEDGEPRRKRRRDDMSETPTTCGTLDEAMTSILASSSDDEAENSSVVTLLMKDIEKYHREKRISGTSQDSLQWWKTMKTVYPDLAKVACQYLSCPPSSVPSEQLFSSAGLIYDAKRNRLLPEKVLPRAVSGDIYHLADYILQQALMGPLPNTLILSYLRHSLSSQIVSYGGVIESISKYDGLHKPHCVHALLTLLQSMMKSVSCRGKPEDCLMLATSIVNGVKWLVQVMGWTTQQLLDLRTAPEHSTNLSLAASILLDILNSYFLTCMLEIGRQEEPSTWGGCVKKMVEVETLLAGSGGVIENKDLLIKSVCQLRDHQPLDSIGNKHKFNSSVTPMCHAMHSLVMLEVITHTTREASTFAHQLLLLQQLQGLSTMELYLELLRSSFLGLSCPEYQPYQELKWVGFTFIKVPTILYTIHVALSGESGSGESEDLLSAVERISQLTILLDQVDLRINCNCLEYLLNELVNKTSLISERDAQTILAARVQESQVLANIQNNDAQGSHPGNPNLILRAQPTVTSILKTLSNKNQDSVLPVMNLLISGKSRDLLLAAAAASGSLHIFAQKFVKFNELSMDPQPGETAKMAMNRALMFDISFLLLCHIVQLYGIDVVVSEKCETFVEQWMKDNMPELGRVKAPLMATRTDPSAVEEFIREINVKELEMKYNLLRWSDVCQMAAVALREVITAAQQGAFPMQHVKDQLDCLCYHLCCLPICVATWLSSHVQVVDAEQAVEPLNFLHYLQTSLGDHDQSVPVLDNFKDRSTLMVQIVENMVQVMKGGIQPTSAHTNTTRSSSVDGGNPASETLMSSEEPLSHLLRSTWDQVFPGGVISHQALATFRDLMRLGGTRWFVCDIIKAGMQSVFESDLMRAMDLIYGLLHQDVVGCTLSLLVHTLPLYISGPCTVELISKPRTEALARLTVSMIISAWLAVQQQPPVKNEPGATVNMSLGRSGGGGCKRTYHDRELEDLESNLQLHSADLAIARGTPGLTKDGTSLLVAVQSLLTLMTQVSRAGVVSPVTQLVVNILHELIAAPYSHTLLTLTPPALLPNLVPLLSPPDAFTYVELLAITAPKVPSQPELAREFLGDAIGAQTPAQAAGARRAAAKLLCVQRNLSLASESALYPIII